METTTKMLNTARAAADNGAYMRDLGAQSVLVTKRSGEGGREPGDPGVDGKGGGHGESDPIEFQRKCIKTPNFSSC